MTTGLWLCDDRGIHQTPFAIGQSVFVAGQGLVPVSPYEFWRVHAGSSAKEELLASLLREPFSRQQVRPLVTSCEG